MGKKAGPDDKSQSYRTPKKWFGALDDIFHFTVDACANEENALRSRTCKKFWTDCEKEDWTKEIAFCNPPFGWIHTRHKYPWSIVYHYQFAITCLAFMRIESTSSEWFQKYLPKWLVIPNGRIQFNHPDNTPCKKSANFGTCFGIWGQATPDQLAGLKKLGAVWHCISHPPKRPTPSEVREYKSWRE